MAAANVVPVRLSFEMARRWIDSISLKLVVTGRDQTPILNIMTVDLPVSNHCDTTFEVPLTSVGGTRLRIDAEYGTAIQSIEFLFALKEGKVTFLDVSGASWREINEWSPDYFSQSELLQFRFEDSVNVARPEDEFDVLICFEDSSQIENVKTLVENLYAAPGKEARMAYRCRATKAQLHELRKAGIRITFIRSEDDSH